MFLPTPKLLWSLVAPAALLLVWPNWTAARLALGFDVAVALVVLLDVWISPRPGQIGLERRARRRLSLGAANRLGWLLHNRSRTPLRFAFKQDLPAELRTSVPAVTGLLAPRARAELFYDVTPERRGLFVLGDVYLRYDTPLGLLRRQVRFPLRDDVKVYPNVANLARYELAAQRHRLEELGLTAARRLGPGTTFEGLREYVPGDDLADMAWKASARHGRLITRTYETDRSQNVVVVLDCGRLMTTQVDALSRLDHAINATLLLTYVAMKQGDSLGLVAFSDRIETYVPPVKGRAALGRINEGLYQLEARLCEPDYDRVCTFLSLRHRKRSLIVILTDVIDRHASAMLLAHAARFTRKHLPVCVTLRNLEIERLASRPADSATDAYTQAVAVQLLAARQEALAQMRKFGVDVLDVDPRQLSPRLLSRYLELKRRRL
jgi:uncharacterized protein (DUF58 family)